MSGTRCANSLWHDASAADNDCDRAKYISRYRTSYNRNCYYCSQYNEHSSP